MVKVKNYLFDLTYELDKQIGLQVEFEPLGFKEVDGKQFFLIQAKEKELNISGVGACNIDINNFVKIAAELAVLDLLTIYKGMYG